jgi:spermidine synthase
MHTGGDRQQWMRDITQVMREDPGNPYYNWFTGGAQ